MKSVSDPNSLALAPSPLTTKTMRTRKSKSKPRTSANKKAGGDCPEATFSADFDVGGGWGDAINWNGTEQFGEQPLWKEGSDGKIKPAKKSRFNCHGWKRTKPKVGQTLKAEFVRSWMIFEFVDVKPCGDPPDMFFAVVKPIRQIPKQNE